MNRPQPHTSGYRRPSAGILVRFLTLVVVLCASSTDTLEAQILKIGDDYVSAHVNTSQNAGRFWISAGPKKGGQRFLYHGNQSVQQITSNIIFRVRKGPGDIDYYCNTTEDFFLRTERPVNGSDTIPFLPYDDIWWNDDTIEMTYNNVSLFEVKVRFILEGTSSPYDNGSDILIEFDYEVAPRAAGRELGIFMMLDGDNGSAQGPISSGDQTSIMTSAGYFNTAKTGFKFEPPYEDIPEFYHIGNFTYNSVYIETNRRLPIHRLRGLSNGGAPLTEPDIFAVGNWHRYRTLHWSPGSVDRVGDVATGLQWEELYGSGIVRTAFGTNNEGRNNVFQCRTDDLFADIRTVRLIEQDGENGEFSPSEFKVEMWLTNTGDYDVLHGTVRLADPIASFPDGTERVQLDESASPREQNFVMLPTYNNKLEWTLKLNPQSYDTLSHLRFEYKLRGESTFRPFLDACDPKITIRPHQPPPTDTLPPVIQRIGSGRGATAYWDLRTFDRHPGFDYDTGLEEIRILANDDNNYRLELDPDPYARCQVSETVDMHAEVVDTTKSARLVISVTDCNGNVSIDSVYYSPRPDLFTPQIIQRDSSGSWDPDNYPCNARTHRVVVLDSLNQAPQAGDYGFGTIEVISIENFKPPTIIDEDGNPDGSIDDFDSRATIVLEVEDSLFDARAEVLVTDYAGNDTTLFFYYCTIDDFQAPTISHTASGTDSWDVVMTDSAAWDRGLLGAEVISSSNVLFRWPDDTLRSEPPSLAKGSPEARLEVVLADHCRPAELILEARDTYYETDPDNHSAFDTIRYAGIPDTLAPNIVIVPGFDGSTYFYQVRVDDIHYPGGEFFECDRGLESIDITLTSNLRISTPLTFTSATEASLTIEVIDTLAIDQVDTLCITAIDSAGNVGSDCDYWPTTPDGKSPVFTGRLDRSTMSIVGQASDDRENDRGLGSVVLRNARNLDAGFGMMNLRGTPSVPVNIAVTNVAGQISGKIIIQDLYGEILQSPESSLHTITVEFTLPYVSISTEMPELVDAGVDMFAQFRSDVEIDGESVRSIEFVVETDGPAQYVDIEPSTLVEGVFSATPIGGDQIRVRYEPDSDELLPAGRLIGSLRFRSVQRNTFVEPFYMTVVPGTPKVNGGRDTTLYFKKVDADPVSSELTLPAPRIDMSGDSLTYVNGDCNRVLNGGGAEKPTGLSILMLNPAPVRRSVGYVSAIVRNVPEENGTVEWILPDGRLVHRQQIISSGTNVGRYAIQIPPSLPPGVYYVRISGSTGSDVQKIIIIS